MVELKTFGTEVFVVSENDVTKAVDCSNTKYHIYRAPSECALVEITSTSIKIAVGNNIPSKVYQHILGIAMTQLKQLKLVHCESLNNLNKIDKLIEFFNKEYALYI
jgi:hypothetical protein